VSETLIAEFWAAMATNDFAQASRWLHPEFEYYMPQTGEYLQGRAAFVALNTAYPANGPWMFEVRSIIATTDRAVSDVDITDGTLVARAITFHTLQDGLILRQTEYWPEDYPAPDWRKPFMRVLPERPF